MANAPARDSVHAADIDSIVANLRALITLSRRSAFVAAQAFFARLELRISHDASPFLAHFAGWKLIDWFEIGGCPSHLSHPVCAQIFSTRKKKT